MASYTYSPNFPSLVEKSFTVKFWMSYYNKNVSRSIMYPGIMGLFNDGNGVQQKFIVNDLGAYLEILDNLGNIHAIVDSDHLFDDPDSFLPAHGSCISCTHYTSVYALNYNTPVIKKTICYGNIVGGDVFIILESSGWFRSFSSTAFAEPIISSDGFSFSDMRDTSNIKSLTHYNDITAITFAEVNGNPMFVACAGYAGNDCLYYSTDGLSWASATTPIATGGFYALAFGMTPSTGLYSDPLDTPTFVAVGRGNATATSPTYAFAYSNDGISWTGVSWGSGEVLYKSVAYLHLSDMRGGNFIAGSAYTTGSNQTMRSIDGHSWSVNWYPTTSDGLDISAMAAGIVNVNGTPTPTYVIGNIDAGRDTAGNQDASTKLWYATTFSTFTAATYTGIDYNYFFIASIAFGTVNNTPMFVACGRGLYYSTDGMNWYDGEVSYLGMVGISEFPKYQPGYTVPYTSTHPMGLSYTSVTYVEVDSIPMFMAVSSGWILVPNVMVYTLDGILWGPSLRHPSKYDDTSIITLEGNKILKLSSSTVTNLRYHTVTGLLRQVLWNGTAYVILTNNGIYGSGTSGGTFTLANNTSGIDWRHGIAFKGLFVCLGTPTSDLTTDVVYWSNDGLTFTASTLPTLVNAYGFTRTHFMYLVPSMGSHIMLIADYSDNVAATLSDTNYRLFSSDGKTFSASSEYFIGRIGYDCTSGSGVNYHCMDLCYCPSFPSESRWLMAAHTYQLLGTIGSVITFSATGKDNSWADSLNGVQLPATPIELSHHTGGKILAYGFDSTQQVYRAVCAAGKVYSYNYTNNYGFTGTTTDGKTWNYSAVSQEAPQTIVYASNADGTDGYFMISGYYNPETGTAGAYFKRSRNGVDWDNITPASGITYTQCNLSAFALVSGTPTVVFAAQTQYSQYVIATTDFGTTWQNVTFTGSINYIYGLAAGSYNSTTWFIIIDGGYSVIRSANGITWDAPIGQVTVPPSINPCRDLNFAVLKGQPFFYGIIDSANSFDHYVTVSDDWGLTWSTYPDTHNDPQVIAGYQPYSAAVGMYNGEMTVLAYHRNQPLKSSDGYVWGIEAEQHMISDESKAAALKPISSGWNAVAMPYSITESITSVNEVRLTKQDFQSVREVNDVWAYHNLAILEYIYGTRIFNDITPQFRDWLESHRTYNFDITRRVRGMWRETGDGLDPLWGIPPPPPPTPATYQPVYYTSQIYDNEWGDTSGSIAWPTLRTRRPYVFGYYGENVTPSFTGDFMDKGSYASNGNAFIAIRAEQRDIFIDSLMNVITYPIVLPGVVAGTYSQCYYSVVNADGTLVVLGVVNPNVYPLDNYMVAWRSTDGVTWTGPITTNYNAVPSESWILDGHDSGGTPFVLRYCPHLGGGNQGYYFALRDGNTGIMKSPDAITWTIIANTAGEEYISQIWSINTLCCTDTAVYVSWNGNIFASSDGVNFIKQYPGYDSSTWPYPERAYLAANSEYCCCCVFEQDPATSDRYLRIYRSSTPGVWEIMTSQDMTSTSIYSVMQFTYNDGFWILSFEGLFYVMYSTDAWSSVSIGFLSNYQQWYAYNSIIPVDLMSDAGGSSSGSEEHNDFTIQSDNEGAPGYQEDRQPLAYVASTFYRLPISADPATPIDTKVVTVTEPEPIHHQVPSPPFVKRVKAPHYRIVKNPGGGVDKLSNQ